MESVLFFAVFIVFMVGISIWARGKVKKTRAKIEALKAEAKTLSTSGNSAKGIAVLYEALGYIVGVGPGTTEWTAKGICKRMDDQGWDLISEIQRMQQDLGLSCDWAEFKQVINDFQQFSLDKKLVNNHGLPKRAGKDIYVAMRRKLEECLKSFPQTHE